MTNKTMPLDATQADLDEALVLTVSFSCYYAEPYEVDITLEDDNNRMLGLEQGWNKAIEHYCPDRITQMKKQLKRKLGGVYSFHDLSDVVLSFIDENRKREEISVRTNYAMLGL
ncbi:hypothetical protein [Acinetobacter sp. P1(2025)]|uniref:hypothetical protein n=1 Tax=Acinetobacter sp. P1(2025) TaxID=3446120 RepID=UPI003F52D854